VSAENAEANEMIIRLEKISRDIRKKYASQWRRTKRSFTSLLLKAIEQVEPNNAEDISKYIERFRENLKIWKHTYPKMLGAENIAISERAMRALTEILFVTEGVFSAVSNLAIYAMILTEHHDIWNEYNRKFASSFEEVVELPLYVKLRFLEKHRFEFFAELCPKELRNAIAHLNYRIDTDGSIHIHEKGKNTKKFTLIEVIEKILIVQIFSVLALACMFKTQKR
jgi:hypothetical protein